MTTLRTRKTCRLCGRSVSYISRGAEVGDTELCRMCVDVAYGRRVRADVPVVGQLDMFPMWDVPSDDYPPTYERDGDGNTREV